MNVLSLSYGKDSIAAIHVAIDILGIPVERIIHSEVWATQDIPADLPPMVEFKQYADKIIKDRWGIDVDHICAMRGDRKLAYEDVFYRAFARSKSPRKNGEIYGWPIPLGAYCTGELKQHVVAKHRLLGGTGANAVALLGIAADEPKRIERHSKKPNVRLPLVEAGWTEAMCRKWCEENDLLSPIYTTATRGGCWFCHNQGVGQLRILRHDYPDLWAIMLQWDSDSPVTFHADGHTVHDFDRRFQLEDEGLINPDAPFKWAMLDGDIQLSISF